MHDGPEDDIVDIDWTTDDELDIHSAPEATAEILPVTDTMSLPSTSNGEVKSTS